VVGRDVQPARSVVQVQHMLDLVRQGRSLHDDKDEHEQRV
jgi:hypothetical protein